MGTTIMAQRRNADVISSTAVNHTSPKPTKDRARTKASTTPASVRSSAGTPNPSGIRTSHAQASRFAVAPSNSRTSNSSVASQTTGLTSIGAPEASGAMKTNANIRPNLQPAPTPSQVQAQRSQHPPQQPKRRASGPLSAIKPQQSSPISAINQQQHQDPRSPAQPHPQAQFGNGHQGPGGPVGIQQPHFVPGHHGGGDSHNPDQTIPYLQGPYGHQPSHFQVAEDGRVLMAATMRHPQYPSMYSNNPQPPSPASVNSPHSQDAHNRQMFSQPHGPMPPTMYSGYGHYPTLGHVQQAPYSHHAPSQPPQGLPSQSLLMSQQHSSQQMQQQQQSRSPAGVDQSPRQKLEPSAMPIQRTIDTSGTMHRPSQQVMTNVQVPPGSAGSVQQSPRSGGGPNSSAAPGPIPASTPRVIREDSDGTMWIEFEYSKDRVKMDYSIKCNITSVNMNELSEDFKTNNCVYPRAMKSKEEYQGNRYNYESECNQVGWALAKMNETLQGKRGLIQRAVDSWRNSNNDTKLRSRRVRRQQKIAKRDQEKVPGTGPGQTTVVPGTPISAQRPGSMHGGMDMAGAQGYHHAGVGGSGVVGGGDDVVTGTGLSSSARSEQNFHPSSLPRFTAGPAPASEPLAALPASDVTDPMSPRRYTQSGSGVHRHGASLSSSLDFGSMSVSGGSGGAPSAAVAREGEDEEKEKRKRRWSDEEQDRDLYGLIHSGKRPKFLLMEDKENAMHSKSGSTRVRIKASLSGVRMGEIPDSFRKSLSVYYRAYVPAQIPDRPGEREERIGGRWVDEGNHSTPTPSGMGAERDSIDDDDDRSVAGRTLIKLRHLNGGEASEPIDDSAEVRGRRGIGLRMPRIFEVAVPCLSKSKWRKDEKLNELGYRMSWNMNRTFAGRLLFLQQSLDAYRSKIKTAITGSSGVETVDVSTGEDGGEPFVNPHFRTRVGKSRWNTGKKIRQEREDDE